MEEPVEGGCLCGVIRYRLEGEPAAEGAGYCHCRRCQRSGGAPVIAWVTFPKGALTFTKGEPKTFQSSPKAIRQFCPDCGTQLVFTYTEGPDDLDISIVSLDDPSIFKPTYHIWTSSQIPWFNVADNLPRYPDDGNDFSPYK
ncbi:MAG: GFA family protein [Minisyncoccia bacterium]